MSILVEQTIFKLYCCSYPKCDKEYSSKFSLKRHIQVYHFKKREVECQVCHKTFRILQNLVEHTYIHLNIKPYSCEFCGDSFRHKASFLAHKRSRICLSELNLAESGGVIKNR